MIVYETEVDKEKNQWTEKLCPLALLRFQLLLKPKKLTALWLIWFCEALFCEVKFIDSILSLTGLGLIWFHEPLIVS